MQPLGKKKLAEKRREKINNNKVGKDGDAGEQDYMRQKQNCRGNERGRH